MQTVRACELPHIVAIFVPGMRGGPAVQPGVRASRGGWSTIQSRTVMSVNVDWKERGR
jgi:hypothetical protein